MARQGAFGDAVKPGDRTPRRPRRGESDPAPSLGGSLELPPDEVATDRVDLGVDPE